MKEKRRWKIFISSVFFVLGFSLVFSVLGVLLQSVLSGISFSVQKWLARIGGILIIFFGIYLLGIIKPKFLQKEYKLRISKKFSSTNLTSFIFGAAFAVGWTPCIGAVLGAILTLAVTNPSIAFILLLSYSLGLGLPFLLLGLFTNEAEKFINKSGKWVTYANYVFGILLIILGIIVFTSQLGRLSNFSYASEFLIGIDLYSYINLGDSINIYVAFIAGVISFLSPCVLPLMPAFLTYLASTSIKTE